MTFEQERQTNVSKSRQASRSMLDQLVMENAPYTGNYCEENVYQMCREIARKQPDRLEQCRVLFISNASKHIPLWKQKKCQGGFPVLWDYHVMLIYEQSRDETFIYDQDTVLPFPCPVKRYILEAFMPFVPLDSYFWRRYRLIPAQRYLDNFASDRTHMLNQAGEFIMPPPPYDPIRTKDCTMNLHEYMDMREDVRQPDYYGEVLSEEAFLQRYLDKPSLLLIKRYQETIESSNLRTADSILIAQILEEGHSKMYGDNEEDDYEEPSD